MAADPWVTSMLIDKGVLTENGVTRNAGLRRHRTCGRTCLAGIDDSRFETWCDQEPLSPVGEFLAQLEGRRTWFVHAGTSLTLRTGSNIAYWPAGTPQRPIHAEHRCRDPLPAAWLAPAPPAPAARPATDECEF